MKMILSSPDLAEIAHLKDLLESAGMECFINNEVSAGLMGPIPLNESTPELWIQDDSRLDEALQIKRDSQQPLEGKPWTCPKCGEQIEPQFTSCWKCGSAKGQRGI